MLVRNSYHRSTNEMDEPGGELQLVPKQKRLPVKMTSFKTPKHINAFSVNIIIFLVLGIVNYKSNERYKQDTQHK